MLKLLNTGWIAHKYGKRRWIHYALAAAFLFGFGFAIANFLTIPAMLNSGADTALAGWTFLSFACLSMLALIYSIWLSYTDEAHGTYVEVAERYRTHGW
ncbi:hypothetical protein [Variovorax sp. OV084]|uniref:hypothetical protein n=1 Tax=Variovorax sp. OV084 TaxID=1882777 RepID=UPI0008D41E36|nr:hypothetical protein [Variovorax sp. OV084]SES75432.1 hypothetical protein SAMN05443580_101172 [Variovorax sp. OV084]